MTEGLELGLRSSFDVVYHQTRNVCPTYILSLLTLAVYIICLVVQSDSVNSDRAVVDTKAVALEVTVETSNEGICALKWRDTSKTEGLLCKDTAD